MLPYLRDFNVDIDYSIVSGWWKAHGWSAVPVEILPKVGVVTYLDAPEKPTAAGWLYMDNSVGVCWLEWLVTNPKNSGPQSFRAINAIDSFLSGRAVDLGYGVMMTTVRQQSLEKLHARNGFTETDRNMVHMLKMLKR